MIGVAGVTGSVGGWAVRTLADLGAGPLRLGGRRPEELERVAEALPDTHAHRLDLDDPDSVDRFCAGCRVVLNCAGPSYLLLDRLAWAALRAGADYVDVSGDEPVYERLRGRVPPAARAVVSAGMLPGLSSLVPRRLAAGFTRVDSLSSYIGGLERSSPASAADMILSMRDEVGGYGEALAAWRNGRVASRALRPAADVEMPFFADRVTLHPFFGAESARLVQAIGAASMDFWNVFVGNRLLDAFTAMRSRPPADGGELDRAVGELVRAAELDMFGRKPYYTLLFRMTGESAAGEPASRTAALRTSDAYRLIAVVGASAVEAVAAGRVPPGVHFAADALDAAAAVEAVRDSGALDAFEVIDDAVEEAEDLEEGAV